MKYFIEQNPNSIAKKVSKIIFDLIKENDKNGKKTILCLPTGSTPIPIYFELRRMHKEENLSFENVVTFNLDEYYPMKHESPLSYHYYMHHYLFNHINIKKENIHIPCGNVSEDEVSECCSNYEEEIKKFGGIDLCLLGIGRTGHIGFNEPGSQKTDYTRLVYLDDKTRKDAAYTFGGKKFVPDKAVTMGIGTILESKKIILIATGETKAPIIKKTLEKNIKDYSECPATFLREHSNSIIFIDKEASKEMKSEKKPWLVNPYIKWNEYLIMKAVILLSLKIDKPISSLTLQDFYYNNLTSLMVQHNRNVDSVCSNVFNKILEKISYFGNKYKLPHPDDTVLIFSPHPDDDVISIGGMMERLAENKSEKGKIKPVYMTNGSIAVDDFTLKNHLRFMKLCNSSKEVVEICEKTQKYTSEKIEGVDVIDPPFIQKLKTNIRQAEAICAVEVLGLKEDDCIFLDLPFYKTGEIKKKEISEEDYNYVIDLLEKNKPQSIFVAGDLSDPHATHGCCYLIIKNAIKKILKKEKEKNEKNEKNEKDNSWIFNLKVWIYKGAWEEHKIWDSDIFLPMTKKSLMKKIDSIFKHVSQKDSAMFPGDDSREFWVRARDRNISLAADLKKLGLPNYYAAEAFVVVNAENMW